MKIVGVTKHPSENTSVLSKQNVDSLVTSNATILPGTILMLSHSSIPNGWFLCNGQELSQTTYSSLYSIIGSSYNSHPTLGAPAVGNFRVPDFRNLFPLGMNPSGPTGTTTLGIYNTSGWNHTHTIGDHSHTLGNHTHDLNSHTHDVSSHSHTIAHTHGIPSHTHTYPNHNHWFPAHYHAHGLNVTVSHRHLIQAKNTGTTTTANNNPRSGNTSATNPETTGGGGAYTVSVGGTIGAGEYNDGSIWNTVGMIYLGAQPYTLAGVATNTTDPVTATTETAIYTYDGNAASSSSNSLTTGGPVNSSGVTVGTGTPSTNSTNSSGSATTGSANPPYFGLNFIIKT